MKTITEKEYKFLKEMEQDYTTQESDDGLVYGYWSDCTNDMKSVRGIVGSLVKKGIVWIELDQKGFVHPITKEKEPDIYIVGVFEEYGSDYKLKNIEVA